MLVIHKRVKLAPLKFTRAIGSAGGISYWLSTIRPGDLDLNLGLTGGGAYTLRDKGRAN